MNFYINHTCKAFTQAIIFNEQVYFSTKLKVIGCYNSSGLVFNFCKTSSYLDASNALVKIIILITKNCKTFCAILEIVLDSKYVFILC